MLNVRKILIILSLFLLCLIYCNADDKSSYQLWGHPFAFGNDKIEIYVEYIDKPKNLVKKFYIILLTEYENKQILTSENGKVMDSNGKNILEVDGFYGYKINVAYSPSAKYPNIVLSPYIANDSVGDSVTFHWNQEKSNYEKFVFPL